MRGSTGGEFSKGVLNRMNPEIILSERLRRQRLIEPLQTQDEYPELFEALQPVSPIHNTYPGSSPRLAHRTIFDDGNVTDRMRARRVIVKGRFLGGTIGYVMAKDLGVYANAFRRPLDGLTEIQQTVLETVRYTGPITPRQLKEETGLLNREIMPALHRLQRAFLVYEDQVDEDWARGWYDFASEWPEIDLNEAFWERDAAQVVLCFLRGHVFASLEQVKDWSQFPSRPLKALIAGMEDSGVLVSTAVEGMGEGWMRAEDALLSGPKARPSVFMLHKSDLLVRSHAGELKRRFGGREILQYLLIDGAFQGAVLGHWRIGPHAVEDVLVELPDVERTRRREEILNAVAWRYHLPDSHILRYNGRALA